MYQQSFTLFQFTHLLSETKFSTALLVEAVVFVFVTLYSLFGTKINQQEVSWKEELRGNPKIHLITLKEVAKEMITFNVL